MTKGKYIFLFILKIAITLVGGFFLSALISVIFSIDNKYSGWVVVLTMIGLFVLVDVLYRSNDDYKDYLAIRKANKEAQVAIREEQRKNAVENEKRRKLEEEKRRMEEEEIRLQEQQQQLEAENARQLELEKEQRIIEQKQAELDEKKKELEQLKAQTSEKEPVVEQAKTQTLRDVGRKMKNNMTPVKIEILGNNQAFNSGIITGIVWNSTEYTCRITYASGVVRVEKVNGKFLNKYADLIDVK